MSKKRELEAAPLNFDDEFNDDAAGGFAFDDHDDDGRATTETAAMPSARSIRADYKRAALKMAREQSLRAVLDGPPKPGEQIHIISAAKFDFWTWHPVLIDWLGKLDELLLSTWTLSRPNAKELFAVWDAGQIAPRAVGVVTGTYFKRRESSVYAYLVDGLAARGGRYKAFENHAKVSLLKAARRKAWIVVEGSANLTSNPRLEQYVITNDRRLYEFHAAWLNESLGAAAVNPLTA